MKMAFLRVTPERNIEFPAVLYSVSVALVMLENISADSEYLAFKVKTTAPRRYLVRPSGGILKRGVVCELQITMNSLTEIPNKCIDRFLIQYTPVDSETPLPRDFWSKITNDIFDYRLNVLLRYPVNNDDKSLINIPMQQSKNTACPRELELTNGVHQGSTATPKDESESMVTTNQSQGISDQPGNEKANVKSSKYNYDELEHYCMQLEKERNSLLNEIKNLKENVAKLTSQAVNCSSPSNTNSRPLFDLRQILPLLLIAYCLAKVFGYI